MLKLHEQCAIKLYVVEVGLLLVKLVNQDLPVRNSWNEKVFGIYEKLSLTHQKSHLEAEVTKFYLKEVEKGVKVRNTERFLLPIVTRQ